MNLLMNHIDEVDYKFIIHQRPKSKLIIVAHNLEIKRYSGLRHQSIDSMLTKVKKNNI